jgi:hypothetical protein
MELKCRHRTHATLSRLERRARTLPRGVRPPQCLDPFGHVEILGCAALIPHTTAAKVTAWEIVLHHASHAPSAAPSPYCAARRPSPHALSRVWVPLPVCHAFGIEHWSPYSTRLAIKRRHAILLA